MTVNVDQPTRDKRSEQRGSPCLAILAVANKVSFKDSASERAILSDSSFDEDPRYVRQIGAISWTEELQRRIRQFQSIEPQFVSSHRHSPKWANKHRSDENKANQTIGAKK